MELKRFLWKGVVTEREEKTKVLTEKNTSNENQGRLGKKKPEWGKKGWGKHNVFALREGWKRRQDANPFGSHKL